MVLPKLMITKCLNLTIPVVLFKRRLSFLTRFPPPLLKHKSAAHSAPSNSTHKFVSDALKFAAKSKLFRQGQHLHSHIIKLGYQDRLSLQNLLLNFYLKCGHADDARLLFDGMPVRSVVTWNTLICGLGNEIRDPRLGFDYFRGMLMELVRPDWITFAGLLRMCVDVNGVLRGRVLHCCIVKLGFCGDCFVSSALVDMYAKLGIVDEARHVFDLVLDKDLVLWNVMLSCCSLNYCGVEALRMYKFMRSEGFLGDEFTFTSLLNSCASSGFFEFGRGIHGNLVKLCLNFDVLVSSSLVDMYAKNAYLDDARRVFDGMIFKNVVSWNTLIVGYGQCGDGIKSMKLLNKMLQEGFRPDELTLASVLISCGGLALVSETTQIHAYTIKDGFSSFTPIANAMISAYSKCGSIFGALQTFRSILDPDLLSWTSIIGAYGSHGYPNEATELFEQMLSDGVTPDRIAFLEVLSACDHGGLVNKGLRYFYLMSDVYNIVQDQEHYACLVDLLGRVGLLKEAYDVLISAPMGPSSDVMGAFLGACKIHGHMGLAKWAAEKLFVMEPNKPVNYTLMSNLYASTGDWFDVASIRRLMKEMCYRKAPGCSWIEMAGKVSSFVSGDKSHPEALRAYYLLEPLREFMKEEYDDFTENLT